MKKLLLLSLLTISLFSCELNEITDNPESTYNERVTKDPQNPNIGEVIKVISLDNHNQPTGDITVKILCKHDISTPGHGWNGFGQDANGVIWELEARWTWVNGVREWTVTGKRWTPGWWEDNNPCN